jgi:hypothetical protein
VWARQFFLAGARQPVVASEPAASHRSLCFAWSQNATPTVSGQSRPTQAGTQPQAGRTSDDASIPIVSEIVRNCNGLLSSRGPCRARRACTSTYWQIIYVITHQMRYPRRSCLSAGSPKGGSGERQHDSESRPWAWSQQSATGTNPGARSTSGASHGTSCRRLTAQVQRLRLAPLCAWSIGRDRTTSL